MGEKTLKDYLRAAAVEVEVARSRLEINAETTPAWREMFLALTHLDMALAVINNLEKKGLA